MPHVAYGTVQVILWPAKHSHTVRQSFHTHLHSIQYETLTAHLACVKPTVHFAHGYGTSYCPTCASCTIVS